MLRLMIIEKKYAVGGRLPPEREIADMLEVSRTVVREALIMLEIEGIVEVRRGAGIFVVRIPDGKEGVVRDEESSDENTPNQCNDAGPFELLQPDNCWKVT